MHVKIRIDGYSDATRFCAIANTLAEGVTPYITDGNGLKVSGRSLIGMLYSLEFEELWCDCDTDIYTKIKDFIVE